MATFDIILRKRGVWPQWRDGEGWRLVDDDGNTVIPREVQQRHWRSRPARRGRR